jgi:membrane protein implicated in regulation of membrane protease activity
MCHVLLLLPILGLPLFFFLPWQEAWILYSIICLLSAALYWLIWRAQCQPVTTGIEGMMGGIGTVFRCSEGKPKVFYRGEIWEVICKESLSLGERIEIIGFEHTRLIVRRKIYQQQGCDTRNSAT